MIDRRSFLKYFAGAGVALGGNLQVTDYNKLSSIASADDNIQTYTKKQLAEIVSHQVTTALLRFHDSWRIPGLIGIDLYDLMSILELPGIVCMGESSFMHSEELNAALMNAIRHPFLGEKMLRKAKGVILSVCLGRLVWQTFDFGIYMKLMDDMQLFMNDDSLLLTSLPIDDERDQSTITIYACGIESAKSIMSVSHVRELHIATDGKIDLSSMIYFPKISAIADARIYYVAANPFKKCLDIYSKEAWDKIIKNSEQRAATDKYVNYFQNKIIMSAFKSEIDADGAIYIPSALRKCGNISIMGPVIVTIERSDKIEIWNREERKKYIYDQQNIGTEKL